MRALAPILLALGCGPDARPGDREPRVLDAACEVREHPLLAWCTVTLDRPADVQVELTSLGLPARRARSEGPATEHELLVWGLLADTDYTWTIGDRTGAVRTGPLHPQLAGVEVDVTGAPFGFDAVLQALRCDTTWMVMLDGAGRVVWYAPTALYNGPMNGYEWSPDDLDVLTVGPSALEVTDVSGRRELRLNRGEDFEGTLHHDAEAWGPYTYALFEEPIDGWYVDGVYVWEGHQRVGTFRFADHFDLPPGGTGDWSHANGLNATDDGVLIVSLLVFDTVVAIDGDPASPTFLEILWTAAGSDRALGDPDYLPPAGPLEGFSGQHHASVRGDRLWLFDNQAPGFTSRAARYVLDATSGEARHDASWFLGEQCDVQSGAHPIDGGVLVSCATSGRVLAFREGAVRPSWSMRARCSPIAGPITRGIPVALP